jgi:hypothetical protein
MDASGSGEEAAASMRGKSRVESRGEAIPAGTLHSMRRTWENIPAHG